MHLFLSPHYDDAVLSCGGLLHQLVQKGQSVTVLTVMGGKPLPTRTPDSPIIRELHERWGTHNEAVAARRAEDAAALQSLGVNQVCLVAWTDCIYRADAAGNALYPDGASLFGAIHPEDPTSQLLPLTAMPINEPVTNLYIPLGAGNHVDHQLVRAWGLELARQYRWVQTCYYEDYPYIQDPQTIPPALRYFEQRGIQTTADLVYLDAYDIHAKIQAITCYTSQISSFWPSQAALETALNQSLCQTGVGRPAERYWRCRQTSPQEFAL